MEIEAGHGFSAPSIISSIHFAGELR